MPHYVAFLRAINVGGHTVRMEELRRLFTLAGATDVETFIASGNVIFGTTYKQPAELERLLEVRLEKALGFPVGTFLRTIPEVVQVAAHTPFAESELVAGSSVFVGFVKNVLPKDAQKSLAAFRSVVNDFSVREREVYWLRRQPGEVFSGAKLERALGGITFRNVTTVRKIAARYSDAPGTVARRTSANTRQRSANNK
jgi:uncharacterized protein (DUF1697 family)